MRHVLITAACLILPCIASGAPADSSSVTDSRANSPRAGAWALQYSFGSGFYDSQVSAKRHFTEATALRFDFAFGTRSGSTDASLDTTVTIATDTVDRDAFSMRFDLTLQHYLNPSRPLQFYIGAGPFVEYSDYKEDETYEAVPSFDYSYDYTSENEGFTGGVTFVTGAEWFASRGLSLFTEYNLESGYTKFKRTETFDPEGAYVATDRTTESSEWFVRTGSARFGLGFYF